MKNCIVKFLIVLFAIACNMNVIAKDYGSDKTACDIRYFVTAGTANVYNDTSTQAKRVRKLNAGDYIYVDKDTIYNNVYDSAAGEGESWIKISGEEEYVLSHLLTIDDNPHYIKNEDAEVLETRESIFKFGFYDFPEWLIISMLCVWIVMSLFLCYRYADFRINLRYNPIDKKPVFLDTPDPVYGYGQPKVMFFSGAPYILFLKIAACFIVSFLATILLFIVIGGLVWLFTWMIALIYWVLLIGLYLLGAAAVLNVLARFIGTRIVSVIVAVIVFGIAEMVSSFEYLIKDVVLEWGISVFATFNVFSVGVYLVKTYWLTALCISFVPLLIFLSIAILYLSYAGIVRLIEYYSMKKYNVSHPCPYCGESSEPATYLSEGMPLHVSLRPGVWGMYSITHPLTGEKMPTLFRGGKDNFQRRCKYCDHVISANIGTPKHIAIAGVPNSGKSTLIYRIISELYRIKVRGHNVCSFTDDLGDKETEVNEFLKTIEDGQKMVVFPGKTSDGRHKSIQLLMQRAETSLPYRLYVNDIAGEMFTIDSNDYQNAPFFKLTDVLIFALDPFTMKAYDLDFSPEFASWYKKNVGDKKDITGKVDLYEAFDVLINTIKKYRKPNGIKLMITYVKTDTGYLNGIEGASSDSLKQFAIEEMGLEGIINKLEIEGFKISFHSISASESAEKSGISAYIDNILNNMGVSFANLTEKHFQDRKVQSKLETNKAKEKRKVDVTKNPNKNIKLKGVVTVILTFILGFMILSAASSYMLKIQQENYEEIMVLVNEASKKENNYNEVLSIIKTSVAEKTLSDDHVQKLTEIYTYNDRERRKEVSKLRGILYANFESRNGRMSNVELSLKYNMLDKKKFDGYFEKFKLLAPDDSMYLKYSSLYNQLLTKYKK